MQKEADYIKETKDTHGQEKAWRTGGLRFVLGLLIKEFGVEKVKEDFDIVVSQKIWQALKGNDKQ